MCSERWYMYCHGGGGQEMWLSQAMVLGKDTDTYFYDVTVIVYEHAQYVLANLDACAYVNAGSS